MYFGNISPICLFQKTKDGFGKLNSERLTTNTSNAQNFKQTSNVSSHMVETSSSVRMELPLQIKVEPEDTPTTNSFNNDTNWNVDNNIHTVECHDVNVKDEMDRTDDSAQDGTIVKLSTYSAGKKRNFNVKVPAPKRQSGSVIDLCKLVLHVPQTSTVVNSKECMNCDEKSTTSSVESVKQGNDIVVPEGDNNDNLKEAEIGTHNNIQMTASNDGNTRKFSVSYSAPAVQVPRGQYNLQYGCTNVKQEPISYNVRQPTKSTYAIQINPDKCTAKGNTTGGNCSRSSTSVNCHVPNFWFKSHGTMNKEKVKQTKQIPQESHVHDDHTYSIKESTSKQTEASIHEYGHATSKAAEHVSTDCTQNAGRQTNKQTIADVNISESDTCNSNGTQNVDAIGENHILLLDNIKAESHEYVGNANGTNDFAKQAPENSIADSSMSDKIGDHNAPVNKNDDYGPVTQTESDTEFETNEFQLAIESETDGIIKYHVLKNATDRPSGIVIICGYCFGKFKTLKCFVSHFSTSCTRFKPGALPVLIKHDSCSNVRYLCAFCNVLRNSYLECLHHMSACARVVETFRMNGSYINLEIFMSPECQSCHSTDISKVFRRFGAPHRLYIDRMMKVSATSFCKCKGPLDKFKLSDDRNCDRNSSVKDSIDINVQHCNSTGMNLKTFDTIIPTCSLFLGTHFLRFEDRNSHAFTCGFCSLTAYNISEFLPHIEHCRTEKKSKGLPYCISDDTCVSWWDGEDRVKAGFMCAHCIVRVSSFGECIEHMDHCEFADKHLPNVQFAVIPPCLVCHDRRLTGEDRTDSMINMVEIFRLIYDKLNKKFNICDTSNINHPCNQINKKKPLIKSVVLTETYHSSTHELVSEYTGDRAAYVGSFETVNMKPHTSDSNTGINSKPKKTKFVHNANLMVEQKEVLIPDIENDYGADYGINAITDKDNTPSMLTVDESKPNDSGKSADLGVESEGTNGSISVVSDELVTTKESIIGYNSHGKLPCKEIKHNGVETINLMNDSSSTHPRMDEDKYQHIRKVQAATICLENKCRCFQKYAYHEVRKATQTFHCGYCRELFKSYEAFFDHILKCRQTNDCIILPVRLAGRFFCGLCPVIYSRLCLAVHHIETCAKTFPCVDQDRTFGSMKIRLLSDRCFKHRSYIFNIRNDANNQVDEQFVLYQQALQQRSTFNICNCNLNFKSGSFNTENSIEQNSGGQSSSKQSSGGQSSSKRSSKGQKPFRKACCICAEKFTNEILYNLHRDLHQNQSELCYICGYVNNSLRMRKHISSVHRMNFSGNSLPSIERRKIECVCHLCGKNFAYNHYLKKHLKYTCRSNENRLKRRFKRNHEGKIVVLN